MSITTNRVRLPFVVLSSVLVASCAAPTTQFGAPAKWRQKAPLPDFVTASDEKPPMILPATYYSAARLFESRGSYLKARNQYRRAVAVNHTYVEAFHRLGLVHSLLGERDHAVKALARAVELKPEDSILRNNLGFEYILCERWEEANDELLAAIQLDPGFARAHINLGIVQSRMQRFDLAFASFRVALPEADAHYNLGLMYRGQERYAEATASFERVLEIDPEFAVAWKQLRQVRARMARKAKDTNIDRPRPDGIRTTTDATGDPVAESLPTRMAEVPATATDPERTPANEPVFPNELAGEADLATADIGYLMALLDRNRERIAEYESAAVGESFDGRHSHEPVVSVKRSHPAALETEFDESDMGMAPTPYGEDMPYHVEYSDGDEFSSVPEEYYWAALPATPDYSQLLCESEFVAPPPVIASEADWIANAEDPKDDCHEALLVDMMGDVGPWFRVPAPTPPAIKTGNVFSMNGSLDWGDADPIFTPADPFSEKPRSPGAPGSIDARTVLRQLEDELAEVREEIHCLESVDEEPAHVTFAMANDHRALTRAGEIPEALHWMLDMKRPSLATTPAIQPMGPPAPTVSFAASNRASSIRPIRARLAASSAKQPRQGRNAARSFRVTEYEIRGTPSLAKHARPASGTVNPDDMADIDGWIAIVMNELDCLKDSSRDAPAWQLDDSFNSRHLMGWPYLDFHDELIFPSDPLSRESNSLGLFPNLPVPPIPGLRTSDVPRGDYGHDVDPD